ncbi:MAG: triphosphoribosyl-dephospho-CoA synthase [Filomicrobium sp.]
MGYPIPQHAVSEAFLSACHSELNALKPGNVHKYAGGHGMEVAHFERAAEAAAPHLALRGPRVGYRIRGAVEASFAATGCNTNLGIILLCAPLAFAAGEVVSGIPLSARVAKVLAGLDLADGSETFKAIQLASPAGLGHSAEGDVYGNAPVTLREAMAIAAPRDRIALAYVTGMADIFELTLPLIRKARTLAATPELAVTTLHMKLLATFPDTHLARKFGPAVATNVRDIAQRMLPMIDPVVRPEAIEDLLRLDLTLKEKGLNPGTTADFVVATLFAEGLENAAAKTQ